VLNSNTSKNALEVIYIIHLKLLITPINYKIICIVLILRLLPIKGVELLLLAKVKSNGSLSIKNIPSAVLF